VNDEVTGLSPTPCEWCSTGLFQRKMAVVLTATTVGTATARLCMDCADAIGEGWRTPIRPVADTLDLLDADAAEAYLTAAEWRNARTVPDHPHAYVLLSRSADPLAHLRVVRFIRETGERRQWSPGDGGPRVWCHYHRADPWLYWTQPSQADPILNRRAAP
jgi:hypothetical protein